MVSCFAKNEHDIWKSICAKANTPASVLRFFTVEPKKEENLKFQQEMLSGFCSRVRDSQDRTRPIELCDVILVGSLGSRMERAVKGNLLQKVFLTESSD